MAGTERMHLTDAGIARAAAARARIHGLGFPRPRPRGPGASLRGRELRAPAQGRRPYKASLAWAVRHEGHRRCSTRMPCPHGRPRTRQDDEASASGRRCSGNSSPDHGRTPIFRRYEPATRKCANVALDNQLLPAFGATPLDRITRHRVLRWFDTYSQTAPGGANLALGVLRRILNFAMACGHIDLNPANAVTPNRRAALTRFLSHDELRRPHHALDECDRKSPSASQQADIIRLLLLTGCRKSEILRLRWPEVQGDTLALGDSKTGPRTVPLNAQARRVIDRQPRGKSEFVFPSPRRHQPPARPRDSPVVFGAPRSRNG